MKIKTTQQHKYIHKQYSTTQIKTQYITHKLMMIKNKAKQQYTTTKHNTTFKIAHTQNYTKHIVYIYTQHKTTTTNQHTKHNKIQQLNANTKPKSNKHITQIKQIHTITNTNKTNQTKQNNIKTQTTNQNHKHKQCTAPQNFTKKTQNMHNYTFIDTNQTWKIQNTTTHRHSK